MKRYLLGTSRRRWTKVWAAIILAIVILVGGTIVYIRRDYTRNLRPVSASERSVLITIAPGSTVQDIAKKLETEGIIRAAWAFEWYVRINNTRDKLQAGTYSLRPNQSVKDIIDILTHGKVDVSQVTIYPSKRIDQIRDSLINDGYPPELVDAALNPVQYSDSPALSDKPESANLEGYLYPETFQKTTDTKLETIIRLSLGEMHKALTPEVRAGIARQGLTVHQGVILASIVEREVSKAEDKPKVAQVLLQRLKTDRALESDATASYGAVLDGKEPSIEYDSLYNTYKHKGLPPGPISNVTKSSLEAVANPAATDFLYFVSGDDGTTHFAHTLEEHEANVAQYCKRLCQ